MPEKEAVLAVGYTRDDIVRLVKEHNVELIRLQFVDILGVVKNVAIPPSQLEKALDGRIMFDGSSIEGFTRIQESDMYLKPDFNTFLIFPWKSNGSTIARLICDVYTSDGRPFEGCPRYVLKRAMAEAAQMGFVMNAGPEAEFFLFNDIRFDQTENAGYYFIDSVEGDWNTGKDEQPNLGYKPRYKEGYFPVPPHDSLQDVRSEIVLKMIEAGIPIEVHHHEVATAGQCEIDMRYGKLVTMGDNLLLYKYIIKNVAREHKLVATFMPKPVFNDNGSGMHTH
ncbi:MAG: glutamine synthetase beta-grasp domain-containing protein, partial [Desulfitobacteriaceae bacterium]|nr:glutamine synthetase beta-grasp domain-containing protein [Desulfitobacteriaceae bacterium]